MIEKNIFLIYFGDNKPNYIQKTIENYQTVNSDYNVQLIEYTQKEIDTICNFEKGKLQNPIKYEHDYILNYCYHYTNETKNNSLYFNYIFMLLNNFGGYYVHYNTHCINKLDSIPYNYFKCTRPHPYNDIVLFGCEKNCKDKYKEIDYYTNVLDSFYTCNVDLNSNKNYYIIDNYYNNAVNINLNNNTYCISSYDSIKYKYMCDCFKKYNILIPKLYDYKKNHTTTEQSHMSLIRMAKEKNLDYIIIFEDDCYPCKDILNKFNLVKNDILNNIDKVGIVALGSNFDMNGNKKISKYLDSAHHRTAGAHAYLILNGYYDQVLKAYIDRKHLEETTGFKEIYADAIFQNECCKNCYVCHNSLFIQKDLIKRKYFFTDPKTLKFKEIDIEDSINSYNSEFEDEIVDFTKKNNKYAIFTCLYDNYNISENNLYYYKGLIYRLCLINRDYDIYIDITKYCYDILIQIVNQEKIKIDNVYFIIHDNLENSCGMTCRLKTLLNNMDKYDCVCIQDSDIEYKQQFHALEHLEYGLISNVFSINDQFVSMWSSIQHLPGGLTYIKPKYLLSNINKIKYVVENILRCKYILKKYEFDEFLLTSLFYKDIRSNNYCYVYEYDNNCKNHLTQYTNVIKIDKSKDNYYNIIFKKLKFRDNDIYLLNGKKLIYDENKPFNNVKAENKDLSIQKIILNATKNKHLFLTIKRYMLGYITDIDLENYNKNYE